MASAGRPAKYNDDMHSKAQSYVQQCQKDKEMLFIEELVLTKEPTDLEEAMAQTEKARLQRKTDESSR